MFEDFDYTAGLGEIGAQVFREFSGNHMDNPDELLQLRNLAKLFDAVDMLDGALADTGVMVKGREGTLVVNGAVQERRMTLAAISKLWRDLGYTPATEDAQTRSEKGRAAARARWAR